MYCRASAMESIKSCFLMMLISSSLVLVIACASKGFHMSRPSAGGKCTWSRQTAACFITVFFLKMPAAMIRLTTGTG